jgi:hypothetical protein
MASDSGFGIVRFFDDFLGDTLDTNNWTANNDGGGSAAILEGIANGVCRLYTDGTNGDIQNLFGVDEWIPSTQGTVIFEARAKLVTSIVQGCFIGLTDQNNADEVPIDLDTGTLTTTASNAVGFVYDSQEGGNWYCCSVKADSDGAQTNSGVPVVVDTYQTFRITIEADGLCKFYIDGKEITVSGAQRSAVVTAAVPLAAGIAQLASGTAGSVYVDYVLVTGGRV